MMKELFKCKQGCTDCCPKEPYNSEGKDQTKKYLTVPTTLGDVERAYKYANKDGKSLINFFNERYEFVVDFARSIEPSSAEKAGFGKEYSNIFFFEKSVKPTIKIRLKAPCYYLQNNSCSLHESPAKPLSCVIQPERRIITDDLSAESKKFFTCINQTLDVQDKEKINYLDFLVHKEYEGDKELFNKIFLKYLPLSIQNLPQKLAGMEVSLNSFKNPKIERGIEQILQSFGSIFDEGKTSVPTFAVEQIHKRGYEKFHKFMKNF